MTPGQKEVLEFGAVAAGIAFLWYLYQSSGSSANAAGTYIEPVASPDAGVGDYGPTYLTGSYPQQTQQIPIGPNATISGSPAPVTNPWGLSPPSINIGGTTVTSGPVLIGSPQQMAPVNIPQSTGCGCCASGSTQGDAAPSGYDLSEDYTATFNNYGSNYLQSVQPTGGTVGAPAASLIDLGGGGPYTTGEHYYDPSTGATFYGVPGLSGSTGTGIWNPLTGSFTSPTLM
jgi:hypothetical protein